MMKNKAGWVALIVLAIATLLMIFFVMPNINGSKDKVTAQAPAQTPADTADSKTADAKPADAKSARPAAAGDTATATDAKPADAASALTVPAFDVLRVEPDGSTVIAGRAQPNTKLEIVNGETVVATADVGATGDFAAIFDNPLPAGDYQLTLRSIGENGVTTSSDEVATVSIPKDKTGELLAMVSKPGEASRIITKPVAGAAAVASGQVAKAEPSPAVAQTATDVAQPAGTAISAQPPATGDAAAAAATGDKSVVGVSAVEIEGKKIFVAGNAKAGALVRIYADDTLVGETKTDEQGRFVVDGTIELPVGNHTIRADMMGADGSKVELRAAVPFDRPAGDQVAAVAQGNAQGSVVPLEGGSFDGLRLEATKALSLLKGLFAGGKVPSAEELAAARSATEIALKSLADFKVADNLDANVKEMAAKTASAATDALTMLKALPKDAASVSASLGKIETAVGSALMPRTDGTGNDAVASQTTTPAPAQDSAAAAGTAPVESSDAAKPATTETAQKPAAESGTAATVTDDASAATGQASAEPKTVQQAPLQQSKTSVIIRRGDTLWQISRRVYGAGVRYTTIYLANEDQIADPDRILPGQIFGVPDKAMSESESEEMHRKHVKHLP
ncbi:peptidoglycan-binding protein LysM [Rhizobium sp. Root73]|uniref:LysM peptidoglycan-binding domain-containing protein n=1 Tax=unclassified Rhizobium TaxID=2613769 RepID=UPI0007132C2C|nr:MULTISPECIES: LysM peptidoglycan-binding domain-containing protein [unclassified Rhizobium]KQV37213.1 peptidoglycan-binding protein LysM [Rhizobium sp. Root1204]KQY17226.1 peptidoglycan-binding protein LysM [Rhizobium sp. Root1334]KRC13875.1 peptidoglycan-binding protein LysM [Rhizobium sp. Root73]